MPRFLGGSIALVALWAVVAVSAAAEPVDVASEDCSGDTSPRWQNQRELGDDDNQSNGLPGDFTRLSSALAADNAAAFEDDDEDDEPEFLTESRTAVEIGSDESLGASVDGFITELYDHALLLQSDTDSQEDSTHVEFVFAALKTMKSIALRCVEEREWQKAGRLLLDGCEVLARLHPTMTKEACFHSYLKELPAPTEDAEDSELDAAESIIKWIVGSANFDMDDGSVLEGYHIPDDAETERKHHGMFGLIDRYLAALDPRGFDPSTQVDPIWGGVLLSILAYFGYKVGYEMNLKPWLEKAKLQKKLASSTSKKKKEYVGRQSRQSQDEKLKKAEVKKELKKKQVAEKEPPVIATAIKEAPVVRRKKPKKPKSPSESQAKDSTQPDAEEPLPAVNAADAAPEPEFEMDDQELVEFLKKCNTDPSAPAKKKRKPKKRSKAQDFELKESADSSATALAEPDVASSLAIADGAVLAAGHAEAIPEALKREHDLQVQQQQMHLQYQRQVVQQQQQQQQQQIMIMLQQQNMMIQAQQPAQLQPGDQQAQMQQQMRLQHQMQIQRQMQQQQQRQQQQQQQRMMRQQPPQSSQQMRQQMPQQMQSMRPQMSQQPPQQMQQQVILQQNMPQQQNMMVMNRTSHQFMTMQPQHHPQPQQQQQQQQQQQRQQQQAMAMQQQQRVQGQVQMQRRRRQQQQQQQQQHWRQNSSSDARMMQHSQRSQQMTAASMAAMHGNGKRLRNQQAPAQRPQLLPPGLMTSDSGASRMNSMHSGGVGGNSPPALTPSTMTPSNSFDSAGARTPPDSPQSLRHNIRLQIEYYFSESNLLTDVFLRKQMDAAGYVSLTTVANFRRVQQLCTDLGMIVESLQNSQLIEMKAPPGGVAVFSEIQVRPRVNPESWPIGTEAE